MEEARSYVEEGLQQRKAAWMTREQLLDSYEEEMISHCNQHRMCKQQEMDAMAEKQEAARKRQEAVRKKNERMMAEMEREEKADNAIRIFGLVALVIMMVTTWSPMEWWAALALIAGLAVFPAVYIYRLYVPFDEEVKK